MTNKPSAARKATLGGILVALAFLALYGAATLPSGRLGAYFLASVFVAGVTCEDLPLTAFIAFVGTSALAYFLVPNKLALLPYFGLFGWYGVVKYLLETRFKRTTQWILKFVVFNAATALTVYVTTAFFGLPVGLAISVPVWVIILALQGAFVAYDILYSMVASYYVKVIRPRVFAHKR